MKEKIKKAFYAVFSWKGLMWIYLIVFVLCIIAAAYHCNHLHLLNGFPLLMYAWFCWLISEKEEEVHRGVLLSTFFKMIADSAIEKLNRYEKLHGELPPEEPAEQEESEKRNVERKED